MEKLTSNKYLGYFGAFIVGAVVMKLLFSQKKGDGKEPTAKDGKKVIFDKATENQEDIKEMIKIAVKETLSKYEEHEKPKNGKFKVNMNALTQKKRRNYSEVEEPIYKI